MRPPEAPASRGGPGRARSRRRRLQRRRVVLGGDVVALLKHRNSGTKHLPGSSSSTFARPRASSSAVASRLARRLPSPDVDSAGPVFRSPVTWTAAG
ncbi:hypothetical protein MTO96_002203 [Rhipicephalus appendiculatus]